jgi:hypothetical protein
MNQVKKNNK